ncbi:MAG: NAD(P)H-dependent oxidoreductase [Bacteroidaceae bacterium]|nr:NAD(P)H-dependent oxidoreductase [Bacteroidaceae bacterium]
MKRTIIIMAALMAISLGVCAQNKTKDMKQTKTLVAYFSASGTTKGVATLLAEVTGADLHEIKPEKPYTEADLDWRNNQSRSSVEMKDKKSRPAITGKIDNMDNYTTIYIGYPIWWYTAPTIINTFIEAYNLKGKTLIPFATSGSSPIKKSCDDLRAAYPDLTWKEGKLLNRATKQDIEAWVKGL